MITNLILERKQWVELKHLYGFQSSKLGKDFCWRCLTFNIFFIEHWWNCASVISFPKLKLALKEKRSSYVITVRETLQNTLTEFKTQYLHRCSSNNAMTVWKATKYKDKKFSFNIFHHISNHRCKFKFLFICITYLLCCCCEHSNEPWDSINRWEFLDQPRGSRFFKKGSAPCIYLFIFW
jgi:hypothetical protein